VAGNLKDHIDDSAAHEQYVRRDLLTARGSLYVATAAGEVAELPVWPISGYVLMSQAAGIGGLKWMPPSWVEQCWAHAKGDLLVATGPCTYARLPAGAEGQILVVNLATETGLQWVDSTIVVTCPYSLDFSYECDSGYIALL
jgi:hypothetical protein